MFIVSGVLVFVFALPQYFACMTTPRQRIFPVDFRKSRTLLLLWLCVCCSSAAQFISIYYIPLYFQFTTEDSALHSAVRLLPFICTWFAGVIIAGVARPKVGYYMPFVLTSGILITIGGALMFRIKSTLNLKYLRI